MSDDPVKHSDLDADLEQQVRQGRKFTAQEAVARMAGPGAMKGASPVSRERQAEIEIAAWLGSHANDDPGALKGVIHRHLKGSEMLLDRVDQPLLALAACCQHMLGSDEFLKEIVREADVEWGRLMNERPHFDRGSSSDPDDPYTVESVRHQLSEIIEALQRLP